MIEPPCVHEIHGEQQQMDINRFTGFKLINKTVKACEYATYLIITSLSQTIKILSFDNWRTSTSIKCSRTVIRIITASDTRSRTSWFQQFNIVFIPRTQIRQLLVCIVETYPVQTLPAGFPSPSAPPLESYCPPASSTLILSNVSELIHPVTIFRHHSGY